MTKQIKDFYEAIRFCILDEVNEEERGLVQMYFEHANDLIDQLRKGKPYESFRRMSEYEQEIERYLDLILHNQTREALSYFQMLENRGIEIDTIYVQIIQEIMHRIGELWFENKISVAQEHYATATTQMAMAQLYPSIFAAPSNHHTVIGCCMGGELHEMGIRVIMDLFTNHGYNSIFLGAGVPVESLLKKMEEQSPDLLVLSVTMPQHLILCQETIEAVKKGRPGLRIAVGGRAFCDMDDEWRQWGADIYTKDAEELIQWTNQELRLTEE
ncbi:MAG: cobalamin-dependent protein [Lachnospiraceae bacterium]|nr:cobalamin-dependent protein [Lachnospiraceae bacterium]